MWAFIGKGGGAARVGGYRTGDGEVLDGVQVSPYPA